MFELNSSDEQRAIQLHNDAYVTDGIVPIQEGLPNRRSMGEKRVFENTYLPKMITGGTNIANVTVVSSHEKYALHVLKNLVEYHEDIKESHSKICIVNNYEDIISAKKNNKVALILGMQDSEMIEGDLRLLHVFYKLGIRTMIPCYGRKTMIGDGCTERTNSGLSDFGIQLIKEMNSLGILIDLSHTSYRTFMDAVAYSDRPVVATHSNVYSIVQTPRNLCDEQIKAIAEKDGVIGVTAFPGFVARPKASLEDMLNHVDYLVKLIGANRVGLGFDFLDWEFESLIPYAQNLIKNHSEVFGSTTKFPDGIENETKFMNVTRGLVARGYSDEDIINILGGNFLRVFKAIFV